MLGYGGAVADQRISTRQLNGALLDRQLLLDRSGLGLADAVERIGGMQTQAATSGDAASA